MVKHPAQPRRLTINRNRSIKTLHAIDSDHYFTTPGARSEQADLIAKWIAKRWR